MTWQRLAVCIIVMIAVIFIGRQAYGKYQEEQFYKNVKMMEIEVSPKDISHKQSDIFTSQYQEESQKQIDEWKNEEAYDLSDPLVVENAYGTFTTSLYYYAKTDTPSYVQCTIEAEGASKTKEILDTVSGDTYVKEHEYQIIGLVPGEKNKISLQFFNKDKRVFYKTYFYVSMPKDDVIPDIISKEKGDSKTQMSDGFFTLLGHDKTEAANIYFYDNEGSKRGRMPLNGYRTDRLLSISDELVYSYDVNKIAFMDRLGKITKTIDIGKYEFHHDFMYDKTSKSILCLANNTEKDTIEDTLIAVDLKNGKVTELIDFENLLSEMRSRAVQREGGKNTYGGTELDWLHLNSLDMIEDGQVIVSSREQSTLIKVKDIYKNPQIDYMIHSGSLYKGTEYEDLLLEQKGDFVGQAGQHTITMKRDSDLPEGQYYLYMFNNNMGNAATIPSFDWSLYPGVGTFEKGNHSYYYEYLVDEKAGTYKLTKKFSLPYSSIVSSVQHFGKTISFSSGMSKCFGEYDADGNMIKTFTYDAEKYSYRVLKYDFKDFYYR